MPAPQYFVTPWDNVRRWLVVKTEDGKRAVGYMVEVNIIPGQSWCGCRFYECHKPLKSQPVKPCRHIRMVEDHIITLAEKCRRANSSE